MDVDMELNVRMKIDLEDLAEQLCRVDDEKVVEFISLIDEFASSNELTVAIIKKLLNTLKSEDEYEVFIAEILGDI